MADAPRVVRPAAVLPSPSPVIPINWPLQLTTPVTPTLSRGHYRPAESPGKRAGRLYGAGVDGSVVRQRLERALRGGLRARDTVAVSALRSALAEIDNAGAAAGLGAGEAGRRGLSAGEAEQIVRAEIAERRAAARDYEQAGHASQASRLRREADVLTSALGMNEDP